MDHSDGSMLAVLITGVIQLVIFAVAYIYFSYTTMVIANKTGTQGAWMAWVPIANMILMLNIAEKPIWWIIMFFIPFVNVIFAVLLYMAIAEKCGKPSWVGILIIVPVVNFFVPAYLAFM
jgi:hypothetical protein